MSPYSIRSCLLFDFNVQVYVEAFIIAIKESITIGILHRVVSKISTRTIIAYLEAEIKVYYR